jgi:outer membrane protein assembly factor BamD
LKKKIFLIPLLLVLLTSFFSGCSSSGGKDINTEDPEEAFRIAKRKYDKKDYVDAIDDFSFIKLKFPGTKIADEVQFYLADSYFHREEFILASYEYEMLLKNYPLSPWVPETRYKLGASYYELSPKYSLDQEFTYYAVNELKIFLEQYPTNKFASDAEKKLKELENKLAYKLFKTGELYMKMDDYKSAAIYFSTVCEEYIDSEWADDAMIGQVDALMSAKKYKDAKTVLDRFYKLFPGSNLKSKADKFKSSLKEVQSQ